MRALPLTEGECLFVAGASGTIGTLMIQLAVDCDDADWQAQVLRWMPAGVSAALAIQPGTATGSMSVVRDAGTVVTVSGDTVVAERNIRVFQFEHQDGMREMLAGLVDRIASGRIRLVLEHVYPFDEALRALEKTETRHARGKVAVSLAPAP